MRSAGRAAVLLALAGACAGGEGEPPERPAADRRSLEPAPRELLRPAGHGTWPDPEDPSVLRAWVDARVANVRYAKRVFVEVEPSERNGTLQFWQERHKFSPCMDERPAGRWFPATPVWVREETSPGRPEPARDAFYGQEKASM